MCESPHRFINVQSILNRNQSNIALVIGNGINRYGSCGNSWEDILNELRQRHAPSMAEAEKGISLTEFYDILELNTESSVSNILQKDFCNAIGKLRPSVHHSYIVSWAKKSNLPILTTNFDDNLGVAGDCGKHKTIKGKSKFTDFYPWSSYYGQSELAGPCQGFGIWHINGMRNYHRSLRLGLSQYMLSVSRANDWIFSSKDRHLFSEIDSDDWIGSNSWLKIFFCTPLLFFGLQLDENEIFLRWLLIQRLRYFRKHPKMKKYAWYIHANNEREIGLGKKLFLEEVGVEIVSVPSYEDIYGESIWSS